MESFEIDHIEVSDTMVRIDYWILGSDKRQRILFETNDFEVWLTADRNQSVTGYWDMWDAGNGSEQVFSDIKRYLWYRINQLSPSDQATQPSYRSKKPMTRVSHDSSNKTGSRSA